MYYFQAKDILAKVEKRRLYKHVGQTQALEELSKVRACNLHTSIALHFFQQKDRARICSEMIHCLTAEELQQEGLQPLSEDDMLVLVRPNLFPIRELLHNVLNF